jgi:hypothetical protein
MENSKFENISNLKEQWLEEHFFLSKVWPQPFP